VSDLSLRLVFQTSDLVLASRVNLLFRTTVLNLTGITRRHCYPSFLRYVSFPMHISHAGCIQTPLILIITVRLRVVRQLSELTFAYYFQDASSPPSVDAPLLRSDRSWQAARPCARPVARRDSVGTKCRLQSHCAFSSDQRTPNNGEILVQTIYCC